MNRFLVCAIATAAIFVGCGGSESSEPAEPAGPSEATETAAVRSTVLGFFNAVADGRGEKACLKMTKPGAKSVKRALVNGETYGDRIPCQKFMRMLARALTPANAQVYADARVKEVVLGPGAAFAYLSNGNGMIELYENDEGGTWLIDVWQNPPRGKLTSNSPSPEKKPKPAPKPKPVEDDSDDATVLSLQAKVKAALRNSSVGIESMTVREVYRTGNMLTVHLKTPKGGVNGPSVEDLDDQAAAAFIAIYDDVRFDGPAALFFEGGLVNTQTGKEAPDAQTGSFSMRKGESRQIDWSDEDTVRFGIDWSFYRTGVSPAIRGG